MIDRPSPCTVSVAHLVTYIVADFVDLNDDDDVFVNDFYDCVGLGHEDGSVDCGVC